jgi:hypothetical protein
MRGWAHARTSSEVIQWSPGTYCSLSIRESVHVCVPVVPDRVLDGTPFSPPEGYNEATTSPSTSISLSQTFRYGLPLLSANSCSGLPPFATAHGSRRSPRTCSSAAVGLTLTPPQAVRQTAYTQHTKLGHSPRVVLHGQKDPEALLTVVPRCCFRVSGGYLTSLASWIVLLQSVASLSPATFLLLVEGMLALLG